MRVLVVPALAFALAGAALAGCLGFGEDDGDDDDVGPTLREFAVTVDWLFIPLYPGGLDAAGQAQHAMTMALGFALEGQAPSVPGPEIRVREGDLVRVLFVNNDRFAFNHTIHWHGLHVPWEMDGVPYLSQPPVMQGQSYQYEFIATPAGTHWYHCHVDEQHHVDLGMYGPIIVEPRDTGEEPAYDREVTLFLDEWDKNHIHQANHTSLTPDPSGDPVETINKYLTQLRDAPYTTPEGRQATENTTRQKRDWYPDTPPPYIPDYNTFTINSHAFPFTEPLNISKGETLRIRFVHAGGMPHVMHIHGHTFLVTHKDGHRLPAPYWADSLPISPGERYDVLLSGDNPGIWDLHCHMAGHTSNDNVWPGGMMTMVVYEGFDLAATGHAGHGGGSGPRGEIVAGDYVESWKHH